MVIKAPIEPLPDLATFLAPFAHPFQRSEGREALERYSTGQRIDWLLPYKVIGADADYGSDSTFVAGLEARNKRYVVAVPGDFHVEVKGQADRGARRADAVLKDVARSAWKTVAWCEGSKGWLRKQCVALRVYRTLEGKRQSVGWLIGERPARGPSGDGKFYFSNFPKAVPLEKMVE